ncbi:hypothetical protein A4249_15710 [Brevundimonas sp. GW460-12-10-14-LB2]|jgi:hypothetical protein|uniref:SLATT domain-containing protein n=1 Tax=Brevundimonas sp. GW460-12-10-14-LB2 TaxID=1827469 RepID=UPI0007BC9563|nr:SLATT domain-containing protein [Brevundimonas sp. GW460-12-10-14-LB2]ANC54958.1 hypothetical protein A4249_15710 [Brevundimonas sp. GW460-12-10-14-LB2]MEA3473145.1 SLATT domain-containing protein [Pseudomonadota bacterium]
MTSVDKHGEGLFALEDQIRECYGRVVYSHKTYEKMGERCNDRLTHIKLAQLIFSAVTTVGVVGLVFTKNSNAYLFGTTILSLATLGLATYAKDIDPGGSAQKMKAAANQAWDIRESYLSLLTDMKVGDLSLSDIRQRRDDLQERLNAAHASAPQTDAKAYRAAQKALQINEDLTFGPGEIDQLLPVALRRS